MLLVAHVLPAVFGLIAVLAATESPRALDLVVWATVLGWTLFLAIFGWTRSAGATRLAAWVAADALLMAGLMFVGTSARSVATYVAVDGALFAAVFVSAPVAIAQVAFVYAGVVAAVIARDQGSEIPTPIQGWQTPITVTLAGILALRFLRSALDRLATALAGRVEALAQERELLAEAAEEEVIARDVASIERDLAPALRRLETMSRDYSALAREKATHQEARWLIDCCALARSELATLQHVLEPPPSEDLEELIDSAILGASAARLADGAVSRVLEPEVERLELGPPAARALSGFVREAVTNALFHGSIPVCVLASLTPEGELRVAVCDAGAGFDPGSAAAGLGLRAMSDHAAAAGGRIDHVEAGAGREHAVVLVLDPTR